MKRLCTVFSLSLSGLALFCQWSTIPGVPLCLTDTTTTEYLSAPVSVADGQGGVYVVWTARNSSGPTGERIVGQHLDADGNALWDTGGRVLQSLSGEYYGLASSIGSTAGGDLLVCWMETMDDYTTYVRMQRYSTDGTAVWPQPAQVGGADAAYVDGRRMDMMVNGPFVYVAYDCWNGSYLIDAHLSRVDLDGTVAWGYNGVLVGDSSVVKGSSGLAMDGTAGGYYACQRLTQEGWVAIQVQRFRPDGSFVWPQSVVINSGFPTETDYYKSVYATVGASDLFAIWKVAGGGIAATRLDSSGSQVWSPPVHIPYELTTDFGQIRLLVEGEEAVVSWSDWLLPYEHPPFKAQRYGSTGNEMWNHNGAVILLGADYVQDHVTSSMAADQALLFAKVDEGLAVQQVGPTGALAYPTPLVLVDTTYWHFPMGWGAFLPSGLVRLDDASVGAMLLEGHGGQDIGVVHVGDSDSPVVVHAVDADGMLRLAPDPADDAVWLETGLSVPINLQIFDTRGGIVHREVLRNSGSVRISLARIPSGVYVVDLQNGAAVQRSQLVVQH